MAQNAETRWIAACGLDCGGCSIRRLPFDEDAAAECIAWYRRMGWLTPDEGTAEAIERKMYCRGCKGDRSVHWSVNEDGDVDCWILVCCVDEKGLEFCSECSEFPCDRLVEWSKGSADYRAAFDRLGALRAGR